MQFFSFDNQDPVFNMDGWKLSFQIITLENTYGLNPTKTSIHQHDGTWNLMCQEFSFAGQQHHRPGRFSVYASKNEQGQLTLKISAKAQHKIRCVKVLIRELGPIAVYNSNSEIEDVVQSAGDIYHYPYNSYHPKNNLKAPVFNVKSLQDDSYMAFQCQDYKVRDKRFAVYPEKTGPLKNTYTVELIHEESAAEFDVELSAPTWILGRNQDPNWFLDQYLQFAESAEGLGLVPWQARTDIPSWAKEISLCLTLHGMHWSGYVFNTYDQMTAIIRYAAQKMDGKHVLAYLPGWEGRYYWQYGNYRPDPELGGEAHFLKLCEEARLLGVHVMPMFGANCANSRFINFPQYGLDAYMKTATRNRYHGNTPDWDLSRAHDTGWQAWLNPGAPAWRKELTRQIGRLLDQYNFDAVFLDTAHHWVNDPDYDVREGLKTLKDEIVKVRPDVLVTAENWYDGLLTVFPIFQSRPFLKNPRWVGRYARTIAHLLEVEPSRGSTGVHELGYCAYEPKPLEEQYTPTMAFVDGTFETSKAELDRVIERAQQYKSAFL
jgi:hypothetical protein